MDAITFAVQLLNGVQYGLVLFLVASGLTLVFGILGVINLAHGAFYMLGAYLAWAIASHTGSFALALIGALAISFLLGIVLEEIGLFGFMAMLLFLAILVVGFIYEWMKGALEWE